MNISFLRSAFLVLVAACLVPVACDSSNSRDGGEDECEEDSDCDDGEVCDDGECEDAEPQPSGSGGNSAGPSSGPSSTSSSGPGPSVTSVSSVASSSSSGGGPCFTCSAYINECALGGGGPQCADPNFCAESLPIATNLQSCMCVYCAEVCQYTCTMAGTDSVDCQACSTDTAINYCYEEYSACANDA